MDEDKKQEVAGMDIGNLPVNPESSDETPDKEEEEVETQDNGNEEEPETSEEENKVSYSRFKNIHTRYREAEQRAAKLEEELANLEHSRAERIESENPTEPPKEWFEAVGGDTPTARNAWNVLRKQFAPSEEYIERLAAQTLERVQMAEDQRVLSNERTIDDQLEDLSISLGRDLTEDEQAAVLDIMDEFSPIDDKGRILSLYPADMAWDLYEIQSQGQVSERKQARNRAAEVIGSGSRGEVAAPAGKKDNKDFDPRWEALDASLGRRK